MLKPKPNYEKIYQALKEESVEFDQIKYSIERIKENGLSEWLSYWDRLVAQTFINEMVSYLNTGKFLRSKDGRIMIMENSNNAVDIMVNCLDNLKRNSVTDLDSQPYERWSYVDSIFRKTLKNYQLSVNDDYIIFREDVGFYTIREEGINLVLDYYFYPLFENTFSLDKLKQVYYQNQTM